MKCRIFGIFIWIVIIVLAMFLSSCAKNYTPQELLAHLEIYLDANFTQSWNSTNEADLSKLQWSVEEDNPSWQSANLTVYLRNSNDISIDVFADVSSEEVTLGNERFPKYPVIGFGVSSNTITLRPHESSTMIINVEYSYLSNTPNQLIYFHVYQTK